MCEEPFAVFSSKRILDPFLFVDSAAKNYYAIVTKADQKWLPCCACGCGYGLLSTNMRMVWHRDV